MQPRSMQPMSVRSADKGTRHHAPAKQGAHEDPHTGTKAPRHHAPASKERSVLRADPHTEKFRLSKGVCIRFSKARVVASSKPLTAHAHVHLCRAFSTLSLMRN